MLSIGAFQLAVLGQFEYFEEVVRLEGWGAIFFAITAAISASIAVPISVYHIRDMAQIPAKPITWLFMGFGFGVAIPILSGGFTRTAAAFAGLADGIYGVGSMPSLLLDAVLIFPYDMFVQGAQNVYGGLYAGAFFALIGYFVDRSNAAKSEPVSTWGPWLVALGLGLPVMLFATFGPAEFLRDIVR
ncbi:MAG: hypothetical protein F4X40_06065 [Chloroflexi bacterium]|nr:hypothetical protein [Chloroflexota bacterium]